MLDHTRKHRTFLTGGQAGGAWMKEGGEEGGVEGRIEWPGR